MHRRCYAGPFNTRFRAICARTHGIPGPQCPVSADECLACGAAIGCTHLCKLARYNGTTKFAYALTAAAICGKRATCDMMHEWCLDPSEGANGCEKRFICYDDLIFGVAMHHQSEMCEHILNWKESSSMLPILHDRMLHGAAGAGDRAMCIRARALAKERGFGLNYQAMFFNAAVGKHVDLCILAHDWMVEDGREDLTATEYFARTVGDEKFLAMVRSWSRKSTPGH